MATCSEIGVRDFPIDNRVTVTPQLYQKIPGSFLIDLQWAKRTVPPTIGARGIFQEISSQQVSTLRFQTNSFKLLEVQLCAPQHTNLLIDSKKASVKAEIIITFKSENSSISEPYLYFCIPIVSGSSSNPSAYLEALRTDRLPGKPIGYDTLIPEDKNFLTYTTCLQQVTDSTTRPIQTKVLVFVGCLTYPYDNLLEILRKIPGFEGKTEFPEITSLAENVRPRTQANRFLITAETEFSTFLMYCNLSKGGSTSEPPTRVDSTDAYKCVPLIPDENVKDGKIIVDTEKGELLSQVLKDRSDDDNSGQGGLSPADVERTIAIVLGIAIGIFALSVLAYAITLATTGNAGPAWPWIREQFSKMTPYGFTTLIIGIICMLIGLGLGYAIIPRK
jgi:hypothetical protein